MRKKILFSINLFYYLQTIQISNYCLYIIETQFMHNCKKISLVQHICLISVLNKKQLKKLIYFTSLITKSAIYRLLYRLFQFQICLLFLILFLTNALYFLYKIDKLHSSCKQIKNSYIKMRRYKSFRNCLFISKQRFCN